MERRNHTREEIEEIPTDGFIPEVVELLKVRHQQQLIQNTEEFRPARGGSREAPGIVRVTHGYDGTRPVLSVGWRKYGRNREIILRTRRSDTFILV